MVIDYINSAILLDMIKMGAANLAKNKELINKLNVFPVPDGDTGTNMNLTMSSGLSAVNKVKDSDMETIITAFERGLLMGARGNSGVILSQLFRGVCKHLKEKETFTGKDLAVALEAGVETAYQSVTNPVEGTILTVAKDAAKSAVLAAEEEEDPIYVVSQTVAEARASLARTPEFLPILKEVGVVDSGGKGLLVIFEGFLAALRGESLPEAYTEEVEEPAFDHDHLVQSFVDLESIHYGYCTEFFVAFDDEKLAKHPFDEQTFRQTLSEHGDSLLVAAQDDIVKIHIHTEEPGIVMNLAQKHGDLINIDIENMRKQYTDIVAAQEEAVQQDEAREVGILAVALGDGLAETFKSIGAANVITGGQTMNPSTEDILQMIEKTNARHTIILPNNSNIILAAEQAKALTDKTITIIPSKTIPQGISALFAYDESLATTDNVEAMQAAIADVKTGQVTFATRDTVINDIAIKKDAYIGIEDDTIAVTNPDKLETCKQLIDTIVDADEDEILTVFYGEDVTAAELTAIEAYLAEKEEALDIEIELHNGKQPIYSFILMVE